MNFIIALVPLQPCVAVRYPNLLDWSTSGHRGNSRLKPQHSTLIDKIMEVTRLALDSRRAVNGKIYKSAIDERRSSRVVSEEVPAPGCSGTDC
jgi:hypothetical protein